MKKTCEKCGYKNNPKNSDYCLKCGFKLNLFKENINNLIIEHKIEKEEETALKLENFTWNTKYDKIYLNFQAKPLLNLNENLEINLEIIGNNGETIKKYRESIFKTEEKDKYTYQKIICHQNDFDMIKKVIIYPEKLNRRFEDII